MIAVPALWNVRAPPVVMVATSVSPLEKVTVSPESEVALSVGLVPKFCVPGFANVIVCTALGVTLLDAADSEPVPTVFVAVTLNVYATPLVSPVTVIGLAAPVPVNAPGLDVTVYPVIFAPPFEAGAVKVMVASASPAVAVPIVGAPGTKALTVKVCEICVAARYSLFPA